MSNLEDYNKKLAEISALSDEETKKISIPVDIYVQEAENLYVWCNQDKEALSMRGLDLNLVDDLSARTIMSPEIETLCEGGLSSNFTKM